MIVTGERVAAYVAKSCGVIVVPPYEAVGIERGGEVVAGVVFNHFTGADVHLTVAGRGWTKGFLADVGHYVFGKLQCERMTFITEQPRVVRLAEKLGGQVEGLLRNHFGPNRPGFVIGVLKHEWKF